MSVCQSRPGPDRRRLPGRLRRCCFSPSRRGGSESCCHGISSRGFRGTCGAAACRAPAKIETGSASERRRVARAAERTPPSGGGTGEPVPPAKPRAAGQGGRMGVSPAAAWRLPRPSPRACRCMPLTHARYRTGPCANINSAEPGGVEKARPRQQHPGPGSHAAGTAPRTEPGKPRPEQHSSSQQKTSASPGGAQRAPTSGCPSPGAPGPPRGDTRRGGQVETPRSRTRPGCGGSGTGSGSGGVSPCRRAGV